MKDDSTVGLMVALMVALTVAPMVALRGKMLQALLRAVQTVAR